MKRIILLVCAALLVCGFMGRPDSPRLSAANGTRPSPFMPRPMQSDDLLWKTFARCKIKMEQDFSYRIDYISEVKAMDGKRITISGFMLPLEPKAPFSHFLLSKNAPTCAYCPPGGPNEIVEVFSSKPMNWKENVVTISGRLILVNDNKKGIFFQMKDAVE